jgi:hypothetical protein
MLCLDFCCCRFWLGWLECDEIENIVSSVKFKLIAIFVFDISISILAQVITSLGDHFTVEFQRSFYWIVCTSLHRLVIFDQTLFASSRLIVFIIVHGDMA